MSDRRKLAGWSACVLVLLAMGASGCNRARPQRAPDLTTPLERLVLSSGPSGFVEPGPGSHEVGPQNSEAAQRLLQKCDAACSAALLSGFVDGYSRHFVKPDEATDSLVVRVYRFRSVASAHRYVRPSGSVSPTAVIQGIADARLTDAFHPDRPVTTDYRSLQYQRLAFGRVCNFAVTVFSRSRFDVHSDPEVIDLFRAETQLVASNTPCAQGQ